jgi:prevent-host-death family protein
MRSEAGLGALSQDEPIDGRAASPPDRAAATAVDLGPVAAPDPPTTVGIRELARNVSGVMAGVVRSGRPVVVTKHGAPVAAIVPFEPEQDTLLAEAAQHLEDVAAEDRRVGRTRRPAEVFDEPARIAEALARATSAEA